jgi:hypothetical protein
MSPTAIPIAPARAASSSPTLPALSPHELVNDPKRDELIRRRAYEFYERRGRVFGHAMDDWLAAEAEVCRAGSEDAAATKNVVERA